VLLRRRADVPRTRKELLTNLPAKKRGSPEERAEKHLAEDAGRAERIRAEVEPTLAGSAREAR